MLAERIRVKSKEYHQLALSESNDLVCPVDGIEQPLSKCYGCGSFRQVHFGADQRHVLCAKEVGN
jgi:hypothetical protein